jgi:glucose-1-phosphate adenylyltransferase
LKASLLGVIDATTYFDSMEELLTHRCLAAVPFAGRYRLIDFILSNMVNSGIESVAIFPRFQFRSLMDHLGSGKEWDLNRKRDGLFFFPSPGLEVMEEGIGSFSHFAHHMDYFDRSQQQYALISNCFTVFNMNFEPILNRFINENCDIMMISHHGQSMDMYLVKKSLLVQLIQTRKITGYRCMQDVVEDQNSRLTICLYEYEGFVKKITSIASYYQASMDVLERDNWSALFKDGQPIFTKVKDEPPTKYTKSAIVKNSIIANGCVIEGTVENSVIFRGVKIEKGSVIKNSIIMQKSQIGKDCHLNGVIVDKNGQIKNGVSLEARNGFPIVLPKGAKQGELMKS